MSYSEGQLSESQKQYESSIWEEYCEVYRQFLVDAPENNTSVDNLLGFCREYSLPEFQFDSTSSLPIYKTVIQSVGHRRR